MERRRSQNGDGKDAAHDLSTWVPARMVSERERKLVQRLAPAAFTIVVRVAAVENHQLIGYREFGATTGCDEQHGDHRRCDPLIRSRDGHREAHTLLRYDVFVS